jgi:4-hydroxy-tetrahydrodipicolinate reductase
VIDHPEMDLVGLFAHGDDKRGRDAGELSGGEAIGIAATGDVEEILDLGADCVLYMPLRADIDDVCRILESGANVVTTCSDFHRPEAMNPAVRSRVEEACRRGGSSLHSTGSSPGFITEALPLVLTSIERRLDCYTITESADCSSRNSPDMLFTMMGFGRKAEAFDPRRLEHYGTGTFGASMGVVADALGLSFDSIETKAEVAVATKDVEIAAGLLEEGTIAAQRFIVSGLREDRALMRFIASWYVTESIEPAWELRETGWHISVEGDLPLDVSIRFPVPPERWAETSPGITAFRPVNALAYVVAAPPGIVTTADLPQVIAHF